MHLLSLVADRLWLVKDGAVKPYEDDLDAYRRLLLQTDKPVETVKKPEASKPKRPDRTTLLALRSEVRKCEDRYNKILEMHEKLQEKLADPALYDDDRVADLEVWSKKFAEVEDGLARAESLWMTALENLETAEGA